MTHVDLAVPPSSPAGGPGNGSRKLEPRGSFDEADAGFLQQLATVAADEDTSGLVLRSKDAGEAVIARWWQQQADPEASQAPAPGQRGEQFADVASMRMDADGGGTVLLAMPAVDRRSSDEPEPQEKDDPDLGEGDDPELPATSPAMNVAARVGDSQAMTAAPPVVPTSIPVVAAAAPRAMPANPIERLPRPAQTEPLRPVAKDSASEAAPRTVHVVRSEAHLAPALRAAQMPPATEPVVADRPAFPDRIGVTEPWKADRSVEGTKTARVSSIMLRGQSPEHSLMHSATDHTDADTSEQGSDSESAMPAAPLSARGLPHTTQPASSPAQQIADKIAAELPPAGSDSPRAAPATTPRPAALQPLKVLTIQLHPADLGTVTVRMSLKADAMDVQVEVGQRSTARLIDADRDTLTSLLRSAGYNVEGLTVRAVESANAAPAPGPTQGASDSGPQLQPGGSQPDARASGGRAQPDARSHTPVPDRNNNDGEHASDDRRGAGLYV